MRHVLAVSPHLDDAVLGCGDTIGCSPGAVVITGNAYRVVSAWPPAQSAGRAIRDGSIRRWHARCVCQGESMPPGVPEVPPTKERPR